MASGPLGLTRPLIDCPMEMHVRIDKKQPMGMPREPTDPVLAFIEGRLRETGRGQRDLDPFVFADGEKIIVNMGVDKASEGTVNRVLDAIEAAFDEAFPQGEDLPDVERPEVEGWYLTAAD